MCRWLTRGQNGLVELNINDDESRASGCCMLLNCYYAYRGDSR